jgi:3-isopropylmalate dehydratase small subunit
MDEKMNSKTHLKNTFFVFCAVSCAFDLKVCKKFAKIFFPNIVNVNICIKNAEFDVDFESVEKIAKKCTRRLLQGVKL